MSESVLRLDLALLGITPVGDEQDPGHVRLYQRDKLVGEYVIREGNLEHFEIHGRVRDWWKNTEAQASYLSRVHELIGRHKR